MIDWSCPSDLQPYADAHNCEIREKDVLAYIFFGNYGISAVSTSIEHNLAGRKARSEYIKEPVVQYVGMTEEEIRQKKIDEFVESRKRAAEAWKKKKAAESASDSSCK